MLCFSCNKHLGEKYYAINGDKHHYCYQCHQNIIKDIKEQVKEALPLIEEAGLDCKLDNNSLIVKKDSSIYEYGLDSSTLMNKTPIQIYKKVSKDILS